MNFRTESQLLAELAEVWSLLRAERDGHAALVAAARAQALEDAALACEAEHVGESLGDGALPDGDIAYNTALQHAAAAIRALK